MEIYHIELGDTLDTVRSVKLPEGTCAPKVKLLICRYCRRECSCSHSEDLGKRELSEKYRHI
jgi:hypothetical protein